MNIYLIKDIGINLIKSTKNILIEQKEIKTYIS